jgi:hypothetical protein
VNLTTIPLLPREMPDLRIRPSSRGSNRIPFMLGGKRRSASINDKRRHKAGFRVVP